MVRLQDIESTLRRSPNEWRWYAALVISRVPRGYLASYGTIAQIANKRYGLNINARNVAWLRKYLYNLTNREFDLQLHRLAMAGDTSCKNDSNPKTLKQCRQLRGEEGSWQNPLWWTPSDGAS